MNNLKTVLNQLKSEKIKERQEGLAALRTVFTRNSAVISLDESGDGRAWLVVFQALFTAILNEKVAFTKPVKSKAKSNTTANSAAARRLADAASAVRWLTERAIQRLNKRAVKPLISHLLQTMVHHGALLSPVALDYIKALRCVVGFPPHLDHLDEDSWVKMVEMAFNVVLGDPIRKGFDDDDDDENLTGGAQLGDAATEDDEFDDLFDDDPDEDGSTSTGTTPRKRKRREQSGTPRPRPNPAPRPAKAQPTSPVSLEQIELTSLLATLLSSTTAPLLSSTLPYLPSAILSRLSRFLALHPSTTSSSLHPPFLSALSGTLGHLALNKRREVTAFAKNTWDGLVGLWGTKNRGMKEGLVCVLRVLFPFLTAQPLLSSPTSSTVDFSWADGVGRLWQCLDGEAESRWGVDGLDFGKLRLDVSNDDDGEGAFCNNTFKAGLGFDAGQALAWAVLELQAHCAEKLYIFSESSHSSNTSTQRKRAKFENPIMALLSTIASPYSSTAVRSYHLQTMLFFVSRHWFVLHSSFQSDIIAALMQLIVFDDGGVQSWVFVCFSAIAYADSQAPSDSRPVVRDAKTWDPLWTHAIRRVNVPAVSRAASHAARILLLLSYSPSSLPRTKNLLTSSRVLLEIETLAKDLDVQGPPAPSDAVCAFLAGCLRVSAQDVRLYRMQVEEKVLSWLIDTWGRHDTTTRNSRMPLYMIGDMLKLLECICMFSKRSDLVSRIVLPNCPIMECVVHGRKTKVIQDFLLDAKIPPFRRPAGGDASGTNVISGGSASVSGPSAALNVVELVPPRGRERKVSAFMLKVLEAALADWEAIKDPVSPYPSAESARRVLDTAIIALSFESLLVQNGTCANRRVVQGASRLIALVTPLLIDSRWTVDERALVLLGLEPLVAVGDEVDGGDGWEAMLPPDAGTGIKSEALAALVEDKERRNARVKGMRRDLQRIIWQSADVQDIFGAVMSTLRDTVRIIVGEKPTDAPSTHDVDIDDRDGFGTIRTTDDIAQSPDAIQQPNIETVNRCIAEVCMSFLAVVPILQSASGEPTRDRELTELLLACPDDEFILVAPKYFAKVRGRMLNLNVTSLDSFLDKFEGLLIQYRYSRSERLQLLVTQFLDATLHLWLHNSIATSHVGDHIRMLCRWLSGALRGKKIRSWQVRDCTTRFLDRYLAHDPLQAVWSIPAQEEDGKDEGFKACPVAILHLLGADDDIRIRFRAAVANARLFALARTIGQEAMILYDDIKAHLSLDMENYEHMLTRLLSLGNVMVVSSAVRRGPYWHLLETCLVGTGMMYSRHIESVLRSVSERMGLDRFADLFEAYSSQIAYSIRQAHLDFLRFQPQLLGYQDRKECAEAAFRAFTPTNVLAGGASKDAVAHGQKLFASHCKAVQKTTAEGIRECFGDIIGYQIVFWMDLNVNNPSPSFEQLDTVLKAKTADMDEQGRLDDCVKLELDCIVSAILRALGDQDCCPDGAIAEALRASGESEHAVNAFQCLVRYRNLETFKTHAPNLPRFSTLTVLQALKWLYSRVSETDPRATTYHVLHQLFADIQRSPLVNEQIRLLNALSLWVAFHYQEFDDPTLLHTLAHGATSLFAQSDLTRAAQSILEWAFSLYGRTTQKDARLPDLLIRICCFAHNYALDTQKLPISAMGNELLQWLDEQARTLCINEKLKPQVAMALPAWPHQPSPELDQICEGITSERLSSVLSDYRISSNKFRVVQRLRNLAMENRYSTERFARTDFWRLKECIPSADQLQDSDIIAFADLLVLQKGQINSFGSESSPSQSLRSRHRLGAVRRNDPSDVSPQRSIVFSLLSMLTCNSASQVHAAYSTLRLVMSVNSADIPVIQAWPPEHKQELEYLEQYPRTPRTRPIRHIKELLTSPFLDMASQFPRWIAMVTTLLSDILASADAFYAQLASILQSDVAFAEQMLPILVHTVLQTDLTNQQTDDISYRTLFSKYFSSILTSEAACVPCLRSIVDIVLHLRNFRPPRSSDFLAHDKWLDIDFTLLAKKAITCGAYTTALLFLELAAEYRGQATPEDTAAEHILFDIYSQIDEPDGFYGIKTSDLRQFLIKRFHQEKQWEKAFRFHGAALEAGNTDSTDAEGLLYSFHSFGFDHLAIDTLQNSSMNLASSFNSSSMSYRLGWRTETWDLPDQTEDKLSGASLYLALRAIYRERNPQTIDNIVGHALREEMERLRGLGAENLTEIREATQTLMCLSQVVQWRGSWIPDRLQTKRIDVNEWTSFVEIDPEFDFSNIENIMATRISLIRSVRQKEEREQIGTLVAPFARGLIDVEKKCLVRLSEAARDSNHIQIALNSIIRAQKLERSATFEVSQEFASVLWFQKEQKLAVQFLKELLATVDGKDFAGAEDKTKKALLLIRLGEWTSEACLEKPTDIMTHFFDPATSLVNEVNSRDPAQAAVYHQCAMFAEHQYHAILKSPDAIRWKVYVERKIQEIQARKEQMQMHPKGTKEYNELSHDQRRANALLAEDKESSRRHNGARDAFLEQAIDMYARCLEAADTFDDDGAIRLCSLWFANFDDNRLQNKVQVALSRVPSRKFIFLAHQLSARLSKSSTVKPTESQQNLQALIVRMCRDHPFHSLYQVYCLRLDASASASSQHTRRQSARLESPSSQTERAAAAGSIFERLRGDADNGPRVRDIEKVCNASLEWAQHPIKDDPRYDKKQRKGAFHVPSALLIRKVSKIKVPVVTAHTPLDSTLRYDDCVWIDRFELTFDTAGGINLPKISICYGSDGGKYKQLYKGEGGDDLRQDAVMEQVFDLVNTVLHRDRETRRRNLSVRGYKVIPLAAQAGILEFVSNTTPLQAWLHHAHLKYRPNDMTRDEISAQLQKTRKENKEFEQPLLAVFLEIRKRFQPVMRHYFTEKHKTPMSWFSMRLDYTRSVATTSIVGHILGLGDRHISNILMDNGTGEVVHIDLGIAFDQGKLLVVPERVPFRLTADIVDGMGISGTQGVFQRCAEETLRVLREGSEVILTVLEVFKYDPLHSWTASEVKVKRVQGTNDNNNNNNNNATMASTTRFGIGIDMTSGSADEAADRALSSVTRKLDKSLSVEYTVNELIAEATDPLNLATIFYGWGPQY